MVRYGKVRYGRVRKDLGFMKTRIDIVEQRAEKCEEEKQEALRTARYYENRFKAVARKIDVRMARLENRNGDVLIIKDKTRYKTLLEIKNMFGAEKDKASAVRPSHKGNELNDTVASMPSETPLRYFDFSFQVLGIGQKSADFIAESFVRAVEEKKGRAFGGYLKQEEDKNERD